MQQQENHSDCGVFAIAFAQCLPQGIIPEFPKVLAEHLPHVLNKVVHIQLKPVSKNIEDYEVYFLCLM